MYDALGFILKLSWLLSNYYNRMILLGLGFVAMMAIILEDSSVIYYVDRYMNPELSEKNSAMYNQISVTI